MIEHLRYFSKNFTHIIKIQLKPQEEKGVVLEEKEEILEGRRGEINAHSSLERVGNEPDLGLTICINISYTFYKFVLSVRLTSLC